MIIILMLIVITYTIENEKDDNECDNEYNNAEPS